jgi:hypothetical protein
MEEPGVVGVPVIPATQKAEVGGLQVGGQPGLYSKAMSQSWVFFFFSFLSFFFFCGTVV